MQQRFADLLQVILPQIEIRGDVDYMFYKDYREGYEYWTKRYRERYPHWPVAEMIDECPDQTRIYYLKKAYCLYRDHCLEIPIWEYCDNASRFWCAKTDQEIRECLRNPQELVKLFAGHFWIIRDAYESTYNPDFEETSERENRRVWLSMKIWERYDQTKRFFGCAFRPLMEAYRLYEDGVPQAPIYPLMQTGGSCSIALSEVDRLVSTHLGITTLLVGKKPVRGAQEHIAVDMETYTQETQQRTAASLTSYRRPRIDIQAALCELALRHIIPPGQYLIQDDRDQKTGEVGKEAVVVD